MTRNRDNTTLPSWLVEQASYVPPSDRDGFVRNNVLALTSLLLALRRDPSIAGSASAFDRLVGTVAPTLRLLGLLATVTCIAAARNLAFVWVGLAGWLAVLAMRPAKAIRAILAPALLAAVIALLVNVPAVFMGQPTAPVRMVSKTLVTVGLVMGLVQGLGSEGIVDALRGLGLPVSVTTVVELALRDLVLLGESAASLSEALALRSVGRNDRKTLSAAGVMGITFLRAQRRASVRAEAMLLRGYDATSVVAPPRRAWGPADAGYAVAVLVLVGLCVYLEVLMP